MVIRRKNIRMQGWDYSGTAWYFVTVCCKDRRKVFGEVVDATGTPISSLPPSEWSAIGECTMSPSPEGQACADVLRAAEASARSSRVVAYVVMPNHIHIVVALRKDDASSTLGDFVHYLKSSITRAVRKLQPGIELWQRGYYEHVIRDDDDLERIMEYIASNPAKWANDRYFA